MKRLIHTLLFALLALAPLASSQATAAPTEAKRLRTAPWPSAVLEAAALIPVQEGGRIKPLSSMAGFMMLSINGKRSLETEWGENLDPVAWFLDCVFFPEQAMGYRMLQVVDYRIIESIGVPRRTTKRADRYSMLEVLPGSEQLEQQSRAFSQKDSKQRTVLENQILNLGHNMRRLLYLTSFMDFARSDFELSKMPELEAAYPDIAYINAVELLKELEAVRSRVATSGVEPSAGINDALGEAQRQLEAARFVDLIPPTRPELEEYMSPATVLEQALIEGMALPKELALVERFPQLMSDRLDLDKLGAGIIALQAELQKLAVERGEFSKVKEEVVFYERDWFTRSQVSFWIGFLFCMLSFFFANKSLPWKATYGAGFLLVLLGEFLVIGGIVSRCLLKDRPPITTVYEALLFIFAAIVLMSLFIEVFKRNAFALSLAAVLGGAGMYIGEWNVTTEKLDTISPLVAVLDTNFWLSIHVPTITLGYAAGILAAFLGHIFLFGKIWDVARRCFDRPGVSKKFFSELTKMTYGVLCFGALTATVGTILGGVWANDSWGRFWGWDPKENGALLLCLGYIFILHGRMGGYLRQFGIALTSIMLGNVVLFAFWGVNLLQVGFHSYGFDATKKVITDAYYVTEWSVVALGTLVWAADRLLHKAKLAS